MPSSVFILWPPLAVGLEQHMTLNSKRWYLLGRKKHFFVRQEKKKNIVWNSPPPARISFWNPFKKMLDRKKIIKKMFWTDHKRNLSSLFPIPTYFANSPISLIKYNGGKLSFKIFSPTMSSSSRPRIFILGFFLILLDKIDLFFKNRMSLYHFLLYVCEIWAHIDIFKRPNLSFKIAAPAVSSI